MLSRTARAVLIMAVLGGGGVVAQAGIGSEDPLGIPGMTEDASSLFAPTFTSGLDELKGSPTLLPDVVPPPLDGNFAGISVARAPAPPPPPPPSDPKVPEPASLSLLAFGAITLLARRKR